MNDVPRQKMLAVKHWAWIVVVLYALLFFVLALPLIGLVEGAPFQETIQAYARWQSWIWVALLLLGQAALVWVPVRVSNRRPMSRRSLLLPTLVTGWMVGMLVVGAGLCLIEFHWPGEAPDWAQAAPLIAGAILWILWAILFFRMSRTQPVEEVVSRQCRWMLKGSILELLVAVPTHIAVRHRDQCCAGMMTMLGLACGISVMLFSFGPAVVFLYLARWRRMQPKPPGESSSGAVTPSSASESSQTQVP